MLQGPFLPDRTPNHVAHLMKLPVSPGKPSAVASCSLPDTMRPSLWLLSMRSVSLCTARWRARRGQLPQMQGGLLVYTLASKMAILLTEACTAARVPMTDMTLALHTRQGYCTRHTLCLQWALIHVGSSADCHAQVHKLTTYQEQTYYCWDLAGKLQCSTRQECRCREGMLLKVLLQCKDHPLHEPNSTTFRATTSSESCRSVLSLLPLKLICDSSASVAVPS